MLKISDALRDIIQKQPFLLFGFHAGIFNLSKLSTFLLPFLERRTKKDLTKTAVLMNLSRLQKEFQNTSPQVTDFSIKNLIVHHNLCSITFANDETNHTRLNTLYAQIKKQENTYIIINQGINEVTIIIDESNYPIFHTLFGDTVKNSECGLVSLGVQFEQKYYGITGLIHYLVQQLTLQGINIREISSTYTELIFYIRKGDTKLAFDTLSDLL